MKKKLKNYLIKQSLVQFCSIPVLITIMLIFIDCTGNLGNCDGKIEYDSSPAAQKNKTVDKKCKYYLYIENYFNNDNVKVIIDEETLFNQRVKTNKSVGSTSERIFIDKKYYGKKMKIIVNNRKCLESTIDTNFRRANLLFLSDTLRLEFSKDYYYLPI